MKSGSHKQSVNGEYFVVFDCKKKLINQEEFMKDANETMTDKDYL